MSRVTVRQAVDRRVCFYCLFRGAEERATAVVHDKRGCVPCCQEHTRWRASSTSKIGGHSDCPLGLSGVDERWEHVSVFAS